MIEIFHAFVDAAKSEGREFILIGSHAVNPHGYDRTTIDFVFLVLGSDQAAWKKIMARLDYSPFHDTKTVIQFAPDAGRAMIIDLMLVDPPTFEELTRQRSESLWQQTDQGHRHPPLDRLETPRHAYLGSRRSRQGSLQHPEYHLNPQIRNQLPRIPGNPQPLCHRKHP
jgi:hypothetical protein